MTSYYWINCGYCGLNISMAGGNKILMTSCGHLFCSGCAKGCVQPVCFTCKNPVSKCIPVNNQMPKNVGDLFKSPTDEINNLKKAITFQIESYNRVLPQLEKLINHHKMEHTKARQRLQDSAVQLKEVNAKIPEAQQMIEKLQNAVKTLAQNKSSRLNRSGGLQSPLNRSGGMGMPMGAQNGGMGMSMGGQNGGMGMSFGGQNGGMGRSLSGQNRGMGMSLGGHNSGMGMSLGGQNGGMGMSLGGQNGGMGRSLSGQNGGMRMYMGGQNGGMGMPMIGQNRGMGMSMGGSNGSNQRSGNRLF